jgi:ABC-type transport system involved in multi-copper enzyme maturation permease subunit
VSFRLHRALAVTWKEALDLRKNPGLLASMLALPAALVLVPTGVVWAWLRNPDDVSFRAMALYYDPTLPLNVNPVRFMVDKLVVDWFGIFLLMPVFVPILISSQSVAGEKERRTLEPLLAAPVSAAELVLGKSLASVVPAVAITWLSFGVFVVAVDAVAWPLVHGPVLPTGCGCSASAWWRRCSPSSATGWRCWCRRGSASRGWPSSSRRWWCFP